MTTNLTVLAFDADDTLWQNETFYQITQDRFEALLAPHTDRTDLPDRLLATERRNLGRYGYGVKGFTLSMIEVAIEVTDGRVPNSVISDILANGRDLLDHPLELLPDVEETLTRLAPDYELLLITKGDLLHQEEKLAASGLGDLFSGVHIVSEKRPKTYLDILGDHAQTAMMIGNSMKSDILPALEIGMWATFVPFELEWEHERAEAPANHPKYRQCNSLAGLPNILAEIRDLSP